jgi:hypothetical protein
MTMPLIFLQESFQVAFMQGKLKIKGKMQAAMRFTPDVFLKETLD